MRQLFDALRERVLALDENIEEKATQFYVAFRTSGNFAEVHIGKNQIKIHRRPIDYIVPKGKVKKNLRAITGQWIVEFMLALWANWIMSLR